MPLYTTAPLNFEGSTSVRKMSTPTPYLSPNSPSSRTDISYNDFGSTPFGSLGDRDDAFMPGDRWDDSHSMERQPVSLLTAMLQQQLQVDAVEEKEKLIPIPGLGPQISGPRPILIPTTSTSTSPQQTGTSILKPSGSITSPVLGSEATLESSPKLARKSCLSFAVVPSAPVRQTLEQVISEDDKEHDGDKTVMPGSVGTQDEVKHAVYLEPSASTTLKETYEIEEEDDDQGEDEEDEDNSEGYESAEMDESYDQEVSEGNPTPLSGDSQILDDRSLDGSSDAETNASGYEEDEEEDSTEETECYFLRTFGKSPRVRKTREGESEIKVVSPRGRRGLFFSRKGKLVMQERDTLQPSSHGKTPSLHVALEDDDVDGEIVSSSYAFARPTNYRRRRPVSDVTDDIVGGSASSLILPSASFRAQAEDSQVERGKGQVQIQHALLPRGRMQKAKSGTESCTRHCSPPPRTRSKVMRSASEMMGKSMIPPAGSSPSAVRLKFKRGVSDSPRKRRTGEILALGRKSIQEDDVNTHAATEVDLPKKDEVLSTSTVACKLSALRGWRSDDAFFAYPIKREIELGSTPTRTSRCLTPLSPIKIRQTSRGDYESDTAGFSTTSGIHGAIQAIRRPSSVKPFLNGESSVDSPIAIPDDDRAMRTCENAVDMTPAMGTTQIDSTPISEMLVQLSKSQVWPDVGQDERDGGRKQPGYQTEDPVQQLNRSREVQVETRHEQGRRVSQPEITVVGRSKPIQCPAPRRERQ